MASVDETHRQIAKKIRALARKRHITLTHLPDLAGVGPTQFFDLIAGRRSVTIRWLEKVAGALDVHVSELLAPEKGGRK